MTIVKMCKGPRVAIIMATYNDEDTIYLAVKSVLESSYPVHLYLIDDCSNPPAIEFISKSGNIFHRRLKSNSGLTAALNVGLSEVLAGGYEFIGRMDADDISHPRRLGEQVLFLDENPNISGVGTWANFIDQETGGGGL